MARSEDESTALTPANPGPPPTAPSSSSSTEPAPIPLEELVGLPSLLAPSVTHRGDRIAFYWDRTGQNELYVQSVDRDDVRQVSHGEVPRSVDSGLLWDRRGTTIVFAKDTEGDERFDLYRIEVDTGRVHLITPLGASVLLTDVSPDNRWLLLATNAPAPSGRAQLNAWRVPLEGGELSILTDFPNPVGLSGAIQYAPDGGEIAFSANESPDLRNSDIYLCGPAGEDPHRVARTREGSRDSFSSWHPDGGRIAFDSDASGITRPIVRDLRTGTEQLFGDGTADEYAGRFSPDGRWLYTIRFEGVREVPRLYHVESGQAFELPESEGVVRPIGFAEDGQSLVCTQTDSANPPQLIVVGPDQPARTVRGPELGGIDPARLVRATTVRYPTFDGRSIEALLYRPYEDRSPGRRPAIIEIHGGPTANFFHRFDPFAQHLVSRGFVLLQPNPRGSTGYGPEFRDLGRLDWGGGDLADVIKGAEFLATLPFVDPERVGVWGGSYGGYLSYLAAVRHPERWKAAAAWMGMTDLERLYDGSREHFQYLLRQQMGDPATHRALWRERSPIHSADRLRAKLLIVHGTNDPRVPIDQARAFRDRLAELGREEGRDFEYHELTEEGHGSSAIDQKLRCYGTVAEFFSREL